MNKNQKAARTGIQNGSENESIATGNRNDFQGNYDGKKGITQQTQSTVIEISSFQDEIILSNNKIAHDSVLSEIVEGLHPINFRARANLSGDQKITQKHFAVIIIEEILEKTVELNCGLCRQLDFIYSFNGEYWRLLDREELKNILGECAEKLGVDHITSSYHKFKEELYKQFLAAAYLPKPERTNEKVLINLQNGTYEISKRGGKLRDFSRADFLTYQLGFAFDKTAICPKWHAFLDEVLPDKSSQNLLAEYIAYVFARHLKLEKALILFGTGANGKSVVFEVVNALLGVENVSNYSLESLGDQYYRAMIANKLLNYSSEISNRLQAEKFKQLASGEPIEARLPYGQPMTLTDYARLAFNCNELPKDVEHTVAFFRRFLIIHFGVTIPEAKRNPNLPFEIIESELSGIFNWVLEGLTRLLRQGKFSPCAASQEAVETYRKESDSVAMFIDEYEYKQSSTNYEFLKDLYQSYKTFCTDNGYRPVHSRNLIKRLAALGFETEKKSMGKIIYLERR